MVGARYRYVGPADVRAVALVGSEGHRIRSRDEFEAWVGGIPARDLAEPFTYVVDVAALDRAGIDHPDGFTVEFVFRRCTRCQERGVVKEDGFSCAVCGGDLPEHWNVDPAR